MTSSVDSPRKVGNREGAVNPGFPLLVYMNSSRIPDLLQDTTSLINNEQLGANEGEHGSELEEEKEKL